jgi:hypothetical protein
VFLLFQLSYSSSNKTAQLPSPYSTSMSLLPPPPLPSLPLATSTPGHIPPSLTIPPRPLPSLCKQLAAAQGPLGSLSASTCLPVVWSKVKNGERGRRRHSKGCFLGRSRRRPSLGVRSWMQIEYVKSRSKSKKSDKVRRKWGRGTADTEERSK